MAYQQPPRADHDGPVTVRRLEADGIRIAVTTNGTTEAIECSEYNASRVLGTLAVLLGVRIVPADAKGIKLT